VDSVLGQLHAVQGIRSVGRTRANGVGRINILDSGNFTMLGKVVHHGLFHEFSNGWQLFVATSVRSCQSSKDLFSSTFGNHHHGVTLLLDTTQQMWQAAVFTFKYSRNFGDQAQVNVTIRHGGVRCDESCRATHELDDTNSIGQVANCFRLGRTKGNLSSLDRRTETKLKGK
jgi:hypothetical protein